jgi:hypothetical protein
MQEFLDCFATIIGEDEYAVMMLDQAGWHGAGDLPSNACSSISRSASSPTPCTLTTMKSSRLPAIPGTD